MGKRVKETETQMNIVNSGIQYGLRYIYIYHTFAERIISSLRRATSKEMRGLRWKDKMKFTFLVNKGRR